MEVEAQDLQSTQSEFMEFHLSQYVMPHPFFKKINLFIYFILFYFWLPWVFIAACGLSLVAVSRGYSVAVHGLLIAVASLVAEHGL